MPGKPRRKRRTPTSTWTRTARYWTASPHSMVPLPQASRVSLRHWTALPATTAICPWTATPPAIKLARTGFPVDERYRSLAEFRLEVLREDPTTRRLFLDGEGNVPETGTLIQQPKLAKTLQTLARDGRDGFYRGELAQKLTRDVRAAAGIWTAEDLADYESIKRKPRIIDFRAHAS